jgi:carbamoyl-phosphate synthase small subunit
VHLNDSTVEGLRGRDMPLMTIQYHTEASPGPLDNMYLFQRFIELVVSLTTPARRPAARCAKRA